MRVPVKGLHGKLWDMEENQEILAPIWFDEDAGLFEAYQVNPMGRIKVNGNLDRFTWLGKGKIKWIPALPKEVLRRVVEIGQKCHSCTRDATWAVGDERATRPVMKGNKAFATGMLTGVRFYCDWHYKGPRILDGKGEVMQTIEDGLGARPGWHS